MIRRGSRGALAPYLLVWLAMPGVARAAEWSQKYINSLPDSAFASVEATAEGKKIRHLPHHDHTGALDVPHLLNALARHSQVKWVDPLSAPAARQHLLAHMQAVREERLARVRIRLPVDLNRATAEELAELPFIGPARAFAILEERERRRGFQFVEELKEVIGIGPIIFDAIKDLVTIGES
jgi:competence ComEA-like helix-hairpin-helix protein